MKNRRIQLILIAICCVIFLSSYYFSYSYFSEVYKVKAEDDISCMRPIDEDQKFNEQNDIKIEHKSSVMDRVLYDKEVFLTFDDGPSENNTLKVLKILKENDIKATFFIVGTKAESNHEIIKKLSMEGMSIQPHTYSHDYKIYRSLNTYFEDLDKCIEVIRKITGKDVDNFVRLPGGSDNLVSNRKTMASIRKALIDKNLYYVDWNVSSADAAPGNVPMNKIINNVVGQCSGRKMCVVLMHDSYTKSTTVDALPYIIKNLKKQGFVFKTFNELNGAEKQKMIKLKVINR